MNYDNIESADLNLVIAWFAQRGIEARRRPSSLSEQSPDLELWKAGALIGFCELKSLGLGPWDWESAVEVEDGLVAFPGNYSGPIDKTKARLANAVVKASSQLCHATSDNDLLRIVALVGQGPDTDIFDVQAVMTGEEKRAFLPPYRDADNPNKKIVEARRAIDALIWFDGDGHDHCMVNEANGQRRKLSATLLKRPA